MNWGFYDHPEARDVTELIGLVKPDGALKEWGRDFQLLSPKLPDLIKRPRTITGPPLDWDRCLTSDTEARKFREAFYQQCIPANQTNSSSNQK